MTRPTTPPAAPATPPNSDLHRWITDPDNPHKPRTWPAPLPPHIRRQLTHLSHTVQPLILIEITFSTDTQTTTLL